MNDLQERLQTLRQERQTIEEEQGDMATYKTNFGVTLTSKGNRRTLTSFMGHAYKYLRWEKK